MNNFTFYSPTMFVFGKGEENNTGAYVENSAAPGCLSTTAAAAL